MVQNDLDEIIKVDLHIHSIKSKYKEKKIIKGMADKNIMDDSTIDNLPKLLDKLEENHPSCHIITVFNYKNEDKKPDFNVSERYFKLSLPNLNYEEPKSSASDAEQMPSNAEQMPSKCLISIN